MTDSFCLTSEAILPKCVFFYYGFDLKQPEDEKID